MIRRLFLLGIFLVASIALYSEHFEFNKSCNEAYQNIISLRFEKGEVILANEIKANKDNLMPVVLENYIDFFKIFIAEDEQQFSQLERNKENRLTIIRDQPSEEPMYLWSQATINLQWAFARMKFGEYYTAAFELRRAFLLLEENDKKYPEFLPNKLLLGLLHALVGSIPDDYQWIVKLASMNGSVNQGINEMKQVLGECEKSIEFKYLKEEAVFFLGFAELNLSAEPDNSLLLLNTLKTTDSSNLLLVFLKATIEMRTGNNAAALKTLSERPQGDEYYPFYYLRYLEAETKLRKLDLNANSLYSDFILSFKGLNYRQDAIRKLAWIALINGDTLTYHEWILQVPKQPSGQVEADKQAVLEAKGEQRPNIELLKARLLFDGGYYSDALNVLVDAESLKNQADPAIRMEYFYRTGRVFHELKKFDEAVLNYGEVIRSGMNSKYYYAANSALKIGEIYEVTNQKTKAVEYYNLCLSLKPDEYKSGIHQKAKAGLNRLSSIN
jgi:hypothetical protein